MPPHAPPAPPRLLPEHVDALRADLLAADYTVPRTEQLLGPTATAALRRENPVPARRVLAGHRDPAAVLLDLFTLGGTVPRAAVQDALPSLGVDGALALGLLGTVDDPDAAHHSVPGSAPGTAPGTSSVRALVDLAPYAASDDLGEITWWIASDLSELATGRALHPEHVLGVGGASLTLARITPRDRVERVLDLGCGGGIQALHAARHAGHVIATDLSERALAFAAFNAALNGVELELRQGSLLDPVAGERFDLIVSNPPFVITPRGTGAAGPRGPVGPDGTPGPGREVAPEGADEAEEVEEPEEEAWTYRDGGRAGDALLAELLAALPAHLAPGGRAVLLGNWEVPAGQAWDAHPRQWLRPARADGVDAWVIEREQEDPAQYAETWARDGGVTSRDARWTVLLERWLEDFASRDVEAIGFGYVLLRRPEHAAGRPGVLRLEQAPGTGSGSLSAHLTAGLLALDRLHGIDDAALGASRPVRAPDVVERRHLTPGAWDPLLIELVQGAGLARVVPADQVLAATVGALDGTLTLDQVVGAVCALTDTDPGPARERVLPQLRELVTTAMVTL